MLTMDSAGTIAEAVAVRNGRIVAVGSDTSIRALAGRDTRIVELNGRTLVPGFIAPHDHFWGAGTVAVHYVDLNSPPIGRIRTLDELVQALADRARQIPPGSWVVGRGYDDTLLEEGRHHPIRSGPGERRAPDLDHAYLRTPGCGQLVGVGGGRNYERDTATCWGRSASTRPQGSPTAFSKRAAGLYVDTFHPSLRKSGSRPSPGPPVTTCPRA